MSAELLRRAEKTLREHAQSLPGTMVGPWFTRSDCVIADDGTDVGMLVLEPYNPTDDGPLMAFVALLNPPVALALAVLLDDMADRVESHPELRGVPDLCPCAEVDGWHQLANVAYAILREEAP